MPFPYDKYPWLNFQELNLAYFIKHFREIFQQWDELLNDMIEWKDATDADLAEWKSTVESGISSWESGLLQSMEDWKDQTEADISTWEAATLAALDAWKTATTVVFETIRTEAAASATAAESAATDAESAREGAISAAASITSSAEQLGWMTEQYLASDPLRYSATSVHRRLNEDGTYSADSNYNVRRYPISAGLIYKIVSDFRFQFQTADGVPTDGTTTRIGPTYGSGTLYIQAPANSTYLNICTSSAAPVGTASLLYNAVNPRIDANNNGVHAVSDGLYSYEELSYTATGSNRRMKPNGTYEQNSDYWTRKFPVTPGSVYRVIADFRCQFQSDSDTPIDGTTARINDTYDAGDYILIAPAGSAFLMICTPVASSAVHVYRAANALQGAINHIWDMIATMMSSFMHVLSPVATSTNRRLDDDGNYTADSTYRVRRYTVKPGSIYKINSDYRFQFQTENTTPTDTDSSRVGPTYGSGVYILTAPSNASFLMICTPAASGQGEAYDATIYNPQQVREDVLKNRASSMTAPRPGTMTAYHVGPDQTYQTISSAVNAWIAAGKPAASIYIANGEYNETVFVEDAQYLEIVGESREGTIVRTKTGLYNDAPFRIHHGNVFVYNLTAIADHSNTPDMALDGAATTYAYAFHIDGGSVGGRVHIKNCTAISYQAPAFGMGTIPGATIRLEDCDAFCYTPSTAGATRNNDCILCHLSSPDLYPGTEDEALELVNLNAYTLATPHVLLFKQPGGQTKLLGLTAMNTCLVSDSGGSLSANLAYTNLDSDSIGNNDVQLNH